MEGRPPAPKGVGRRVLRRAARVRARAAAWECCGVIPTLTPSPAGEDGGGGGGWVQVPLWSYISNTGSLKDQFTADVSRILPPLGLMKDTELDKLFIEFLAVC